jgi:putative N6-adenine-specific DNA methylase
LHIRDQDVSIWLDSSGDSLFKRGYRTKTGEAPLNEVLAAGLVDLSDWQSQFPLVNAMCGSGTIAIEAMIKALDIPPGVMGRKFAFMRWPNFDEDFYRKITESRIEKIKDYDLKIVAFDNDIVAVKAALENIFNAQAEDAVQVLEADFFNYIPKHKNGILILNPPYNERLKLENAWKYYAKIGETLKKNWGTYKAFVISSNLEAIKNLGLKSSYSTEIFAGGLKAVYKRYEIHE